MSGDKTPIYQKSVAAARQLLEHLQNPGRRAIPIRMNYDLVICRSTMGSVQINWGMIY